MNRSTKLLASCAFFGGMLANFHPSRAAEKTPPATVEHVDVHRYSGVWYEIARYPNFFQRNCVADTTASYSLRTDGRIEVLNTCRTKNGQSDTVRGYAKVVDPRTNAKLKVTFFWPFSGDYWIIGLDPDYRFAVVGDPQRKYLWILSRKPRLDDATYAQIAALARDAGYDPARLIKTPQGHRPN
jgi:apolipoprotein D and lipocalin family protein